MALFHRAVAFAAATSSSCSSCGRLSFRHHMTTLRSSSSIASTIDSVNTVDWNDRIGLQGAWSNAEKGWQVDVEWKETPYGAGLFAKEDVPRGTVLRVGRNRRNLLQFESAAEMEAFCTSQPATAQGTTGAVATTPALVAYVSDYFYGFDPNVIATSGAAATSGGGSPAPPADDAMWYGIWVPGNGLNHGTEPNTVYRTAPEGIAAGIDLVALTDIRSGDELLDDYRRHGAPPAWALTFAEKFGISMNFAGCNDFVV